MPKKIITLDELSRYDENIKSYTDFTIIPLAIHSLTSSSTEEEIFTAFGGSDALNKIMDDIQANKQAVVGIKGAVISPIDTQLVHNSYMIGFYIHFMVPSQFEDYRIRLTWTRGVGWEADVTSGIVSLDLYECTNSDIDSIFTSGGGE